MSEFDSADPSSFPKEIWSLRTVCWRAFFVVVAVSILVFVISKKSIYDELEYVIAIMAAILFFVLQYGLYMGVQIEGKPTFPKLHTLNTAYRAFNLLDILEILASLDDLFFWLGVSIFAIVTLAFLATLLWSAVLVLAFMFSWLLYRTIRLVLLKGRRCKGNNSLSFQYAALYAILYSSWIFAIVWIAEHHPWK